MSDFEAMKKNDLVELIRKMTQELKGIKKKEDVEAVDPDMLPLRAVSMVHLASGKSAVVEVNFDLETKVASVTKVTEYPQAYKAEYEAKKILIMELSKQSIQGEK